MDNNKRWMELGYMGLDKILEKKAISKHVIQISNFFAVIQIVYDYTESNKANRCTNVLTS